MNNIEELMQQLKKEYVDSLPFKRKHITELYQQNKLVDLETEFHKMKGSGKTYGLPEVSLIGEILETICIEHPELLEKAMPFAQHFIDETYRLQNLNQSFDIEHSKEYIYLNSTLTRPLVGHRK